ncbi:hypothetical protein TRFO_22878 [Tritrichomonas foetus]|uniref:Glycosyltransferase 61 catalytic domain-containing protein n=1 Tax=Tritrichomonas foetus TaxID=1144522 RepID=A0A1J4KFY1_9EUKA|nr:hypothetical protein TRFO_22878 [Tritrichomonas foetus]|eukprot:OHT08542.1 hypothetical protein TRFO_22878 [Tritrichomonas foetus]
MKLQRLIFRRKSFQLLMVFIIIFNISITYLYFSSRGSTNIQTNSNFNFNLDKFSSFFTITIYHRKLSKILNLMDVSVTSDSLNFSVPILKIQNIAKSSTVVTFSIYPPLNGVYRVSIIYNKADVVFSSSIYIENPLDNHFQSPVSDQTAMFCIGDSYLTRWCKFQNVCVIKNGIYVFSPYKLKFEDIFLVPGSRAPPYDPPDYRLTSKNIFVHNNSHLFTFESNPVQMTSRFYNIRMLWHNVMDFLMPTYWTMTSHYANVKTNEWNIKNEHYGREINKSFDILIYDNEGGYSLFYMKALSHHNLILSGTLQQPKCFKEAYLGLRKTEVEPTLERRQRDALTLEYEVDTKGIVGLRKTMLKAAMADEKCSPSIKKPEIIIIQRKTNQLIRTLINNDEIVNATKELCPFCDVKEVDLQKFDKHGQIRFICNASLLIGIHGSGLIHGMWLKNSTPDNPTGLVEFLPYKYTCRTWYKQMSDIARIDYYPIYTLNVNQSRWAPEHNATKVQRCQTQEGECARVRCHDFLRDQSIIADISYYKKIVSPFFEKLKIAYEKNNKQ